jgi:predicted membrane-bound mannosyltransferase/DNA-binding beta-propeller fold protein YncE
MFEQPLSPRASWLSVDLAKVLPFNLENAIAFLLVALAILSRFYGLGDRVMSHDEVNHVVPAYDFSQGDGYSYDPMTHGPFQFHVIAASFVLFGDNDFTARIPAAAFSVATILFVLFAFRRYLGRPGALIAGTMFLISPFMLFYGRYARNEAFIVLWSVITVYAILRYLERGSLGDLTLFTLVNAFHFIDKSTAYIFAAEELLFLGGYLLLRLTRHNRFRDALSPRNLILWTGGLLLLCIGIYILRVVPADANFYARIPGLLIGGCGLIALLFSTIAILQDTGSEALRGERAFDLLIMLGTLVLPLLAALPLKLLGVDSSNVATLSGQLTDFAVVLALFLPAIWLGTWWKGRVWISQTILFYIIFFLFYTTFLTNITNLLPFINNPAVNNGTGLVSGFVRGLGYWLEQQGVERGSQPWYLYLFVEIPVYEYLPFLGTVLAFFIGLGRNVWSAPAERPFDRPDAAAEDTRVPTLALLVFWSLAQLAAFTIAGEKMGWLTIHIAAPMILTCAWTIGYLLEKINQGHILAPLRWLAERIGGARRYAGLILEAVFFTQQFCLGLLLTILGFLAVFTMRTAIQAAYYNYDYPFEYMVYAHGAPAPKQVFQEIEQVSLRATGDRNLVVAYDNNVRYPFWWYMRHYPNRIDFNESPSSNIRNAAYILVGEGNRAKVQPFLKDNYVEFRLARLWWPNQDYFGLKWDDVQSEFQRKHPSTDAANAPTMNLMDYLAICWERVQPLFTDKNLRSAVLQVWLNRDFTAWGKAQGHGGYTLADWSIADWMYVYIRKDYLGGYDGKVKPAELANAQDPYQLATIELPPDMTFGTGGNQPGQFTSPHGLAVASDGSLYIADSFNHRIQHVAADGMPLGTWGVESGNVGQPGTPAAQGTFNEPWGVAVGPDGSVYVADTWNNRIQKFTATGEFLTMWGSAGQAKDGPDKFYGPRAIAVGADGKVFVADTGNKRIVVFDPDGKFLTQFGAEGSEPDQFNEPVGLALDANGRVYVADTWNNRIQVFAPVADGSYASITAWNVEGWFGQDPTNKPFLAVDASHHVFVTDPTACRIIEFSSTGSVLAVWGTCGEGAGLLGLPTGIAWSNISGLWVTDAKNNTMLHFVVPNRASSNLATNPNNNP